MTVVVVVVLRPTKHGRVIDPHALAPPPLHGLVARRLWGCHRGCRIPPLQGVVKRIAIAGLEQQSAGAVHGTALHHVHARVAVAATGPVAFKREEHGGALHGRHRQGGSLGVEVDVAAVCAW